MPKPIFIKASDTKGGWIRLDHIVAIDPVWFEDKEVIGSTLTTVSGRNRATEMTPEEIMQVIENVYG